MKIAPAALCATALLLVSPAAIARPAVDRARAEAERACYLDANSLCADAVPNEDKITACFAAKRAQLSPKCRAVFDKGL